MALSPERKDVRLGKLYFVYERYTSAVSILFDWSVQYIPKPPFTVILWCGGKKDLYYISSFT